TRLAAVAQVHPLGSRRLQLEARSTLSSDVHEVSAVAPDESPTPAGRAPRTFAGEPVRRLLLVALGLAAFAVTLVMIAVVRGPQLSIVDEPAHADYAYQVAHGHIPAKGSLIAQEIRSEWACHGLGNDRSQLPGCGTGSGAFAVGSQDYTFGDPPVYYAITGVLARGLDAVTSGHGQFITLGRSVGAGWLFSAMFVLYLALRKFRVAWPYAAAAAVLLPLCPGVLASTSTINNDGAAAVSGAAALFVLARITAQRNYGWV